ncbi:hypothetical protein EDD66_10480 [Mobilisporobacter senegalensis]|uniref:Uncharacterized protein n=1 Tax=Mobilisporobacter senegalensis TaxID=1329262 RepID=A0A3N1XQF6_9FIRM|nr:hypothetical protein [Mobilisporobacter senegalensis]ROR28498.1 hypothetical protein EDD66_10480 [Mobilisporobacter senegalensis]
MIKNNKNIIEGSKIKQKSLIAACIVVIILVTITGCTSDNKEPLSESSTVQTENQDKNSEIESVESSADDTILESEVSNEDNGKTNSISNEVNSESSGEITPYDIYSVTQENEVVPYTLNEKATVFLKEHPNYFPTKNITDLVNYVDYELEYKHIAKSPQKYGDKLMEISLAQVVEIYEEMLDTITFTTINIVDENGQQYYVLYIGSAEDVFEGDYILTEGLPLGISSFENTDGGNTVVAVVAGSYIEKYTE